MTTYFRGMSNGDIPFGGRQLVAGGALVTGEIGLDESLHSEHAYETVEVEDVYNHDHHVIIEHIEEEEELINPRR